MANPAYTWGIFPSYGTDRYYINGKNVLDQWQENFIQLDTNQQTLIEDVSSGAAIGDGTITTPKIADKAITVSKIDTNNDPFDKGALVYNLASGKVEYQNIEGVVGKDTGEIRLEGESSPMAYLSSLFSDRLFINEQGQIDVAIVIPEVDLGKQFGEFT